MEARPFDGHAERRSDHPRLRALVAAVDDRLRLRHGVIEYTCCPDCIFRLQVGRSSREVMLSDGLRVRLGDPVINLHLWNEHIPRFPAAGPTLVWARSIRHSLDISLRELAVYLSARHELDAICANLSLASARHSEQLARIAARFGFERIAAEGCPRLSSGCIVLARTFFLQW